MSVQIIKRDGEAEYAVIPIADYQALYSAAEEAGDAAAIIEHLQNPEEILPSAMVDRMIVGGEHPMKIWREYRGLTQANLGEKSGVTNAYISKLENGGDGSMSTWKAIAQILNVDIDDIVI